MKKILINIFVVTIIALFSQATLAQNRHVEAADDAFDNNKFTTAIEKYKKAYTKVKGDEKEQNRINYQLAECYRLTNNLKRAEIQYKRLIRKEYHKERPIIHLYYADVLKADEKYEEALEQYKAYAEVVPEDPRGKNGILSCEKALEWIDNPTEHQINYERKLSSRESDFAPAYASDNYNAIIFTSTREGATGKQIDEWTDQNFSDIFISRKDRKGEWSIPVLLDNPDGEGEDVINTESNEGAPIMNSDFTRLYFTRCPNEDKTFSGCQVYKSTRRGRSYSAPEMILIGNDTNAVIGHPTLTEDELTMYFSSDRPGGFGGNDIWIATREDIKDEFGRPYNLGPVINTPGNELFPFIRKDTILYFASDGHPGLGGLDIFKTALNQDQEWSTPENMKVPINSSGDDFGIIFRPDKKEEGFFSSNRRSHRGYDDLYSFVIPPLEFTLSGTVKDDRTLLFIENATVELIGSDGTSVSTRTNQDGVYMFGKSQVLPYTTYEIIVTKDNYFTEKGTETTVGLEEAKELTRDFVLKPIPEEPIVLPEILYDFAKWDLKPQYQDSLQGLIKTLDYNETMVIELASHTDLRASEEFNDVLSQKRAQSVVDYLIERGVDPDRLVAKGYGERVPRKLKKDINRDGFLFEKGTVLTEDFINSLSSEEEKEAAHQLNRRTEFRVLRKDFVPKSKPVLAQKKEIDIITNPEEDIIKYTSDPVTGEIQAICTLNGYSMQFTYGTHVRPSLSLIKALELLNKGAISKNDFKGNPEEILANNTIVNNAVIVIDELRIGNSTINDIDFIVQHNLRHPLMFGRQTFEKFGKFRIDRNKKEIVFGEKKSDQSNE